MATTVAASRRGPGFAFVRTNDGACLDCGGDLPTRPDGTVGARRPYCDRCRQRRLVLSHLHSAQRIADELGDPKLDGLLEHAAGYVEVMR